MLSTSAILRSANLFSRERLKFGLCTGHTRAPCPKKFLEGKASAIAPSQKSTSITITLLLSLSVKLNERDKTNLISAHQKVSISQIILIFHKHITIITFGVMDESKSEVDVKQNLSLKSLIDVLNSE